MGRKERKVYLNQIRLRYRKADRKLKTKILDKFCAVCGYQRKYAINLLWEPFRRSKPKARTCGCKSIYKIESGV